MAEYTQMKISKLLDDLDTDRLILPAMQRNFVWPEDKICHFFDSLIRNYPIGTFLFWEIKNNGLSDYKFNSFLKYADGEKGKTQRGEPISIVNSSDPKWHESYFAVLDGQQRMTSIYIGLKGYIKSKKKKEKRTDPVVYENRYLCIDVLYTPSDTDENYKLQFLTTDKIGHLTKTDGKKEMWIRISEVLEKDYNPYQYVMAHPDAPKLSQKEQYAAGKVLTRLQDAFTKDTCINYYCAEDKTLSEVVEIFVRVNSGGQKLSASDLMLSVAAGEQGDEDFYNKIENALDDIKNAPKDSNCAFVPDKEWFLTAALMFTGNRESFSLSKKENYKPASVKLILDDWDKIVDALKTTTQYIEFLGFNGHKLTSKNLILPVAYYFYKNNLSFSDITDATEERNSCDAVFIRQWMLRSMINNVFLEGTGATLLKLKSVINKSDGKCFPLKEIMLARIKDTSLSLDEDAIELILNLKYPDARIVPIMMEICQLDNGKEYHMDHIWPKSQLTESRVKKHYKKAPQNIRETFKNNTHYLSNIQLLTPRENVEKADKLFDNWVSEKKSGDEEYYKKHCIPKMDSYEYDQFLKFTKQRRALLESNIKEAFPSNYKDIVSKHALDLTKLK